ncbi:MAG TPA: VWA domain-containing protein [Bryobacteraceae bacterium]|jgi:VWFA-related protein
MRKSLLAGAAAYTFAAVLARAQVPTKPPEHVIGATTQEVMLDLVVRDKKGRLVRNLKPGEIEVFDDGASRKLRSFRAIGGTDPALASNDQHATAAERAVSAVKEALNPMREPRLVTLVFDQLLPAQRPYAKQAALELLKSPAPDLLFAVFKIDQKLSLLETYTNDPERVKIGIERATNPSYFLNIDEDSRISRNLTTAALAEQLLAMKTVSAGSGQLTTTDQRVTQMTLNMLQFADAGEQKEMSRAQLLALWALVREQKQLPGRKTVVYFTGGMNIPPEDHDRFNSIVADANLSNVTVYAVNAGGMSTITKNVAGNALLEQAAASSHTNMVDRTGFVSVDQAQVFDRAEESVHENTQNALEILTHDTGGFYAADTNDFHGPALRMMEEVNFHYELTYSPGIDKYDGRFRKIIVKLSRPDVRVQTRSGYYAMPPSLSGQDVQPFEGPMLSALSHGPRKDPSEIPFQAEAKIFGAKTSLVVDVPIDRMTLDRNEADGSFRMHLSVLGLFKDSTGDIVRKLSRDVPVKGKLENLEATRAGHFIFTEYVGLPPGHYTLETAVFDRASLKIGTQAQSIVVPEPGGDLSMSSLSLVRKAAPGGAASDREAPYEFSGTKVTPELNRIVKGGPGVLLGLYLVVYGQKNRPAQLTIDLLRDGAVVARSEPPLAAAGDDGRIPVLAQVPIHSLQPGRYVVHARVSQAGRGVDERMPIEIQ